MEKVVELTIVIMALYYIGLPLFKRESCGSAPSDSATGDALRRLLALKDNAYTTIRDIRFDFQTGKISEPDFNELMAKYESEAVGILKRIDSLKKNRKGKTASIGKKIKKKIKN